MKNKKVCFITIHYVDNHGGVLLAYALQTAVESLGFDCELIDYDPTPVPPAFSHVFKALLYRILRIPHYLLNLKIYLRLFARDKSLLLPPRHKHASTGARGDKFRQFRGRLLHHSCEHYINFEELAKKPPTCDAYICGSDQIWNPFVCREGERGLVEPAYYLRFAPASKRIAYAPSIAIPEIPDIFREEMCTFISDIPYLSCRERQGAEQIKELTGRNATVVLDPTLLLTERQWNDISVPPHISEPYIFCYFLGSNPENFEHARRLSSTTGLKLVVISREFVAMEGEAVVDCNDAGPCEFLGLIQYSTCVLTDSFHGTIFSLNFKKNFYSFERSVASEEKSMVSRIGSILATLEIESRMVKRGQSYLEFIEDIDYSRLFKTLNDERSRSLDYLKSALTNVTSF